MQVLSFISDKFRFPSIFAGMIFTICPFHGLVDISIISNEWFITMFNKNGLFRSYIVDKVTHDMT